MTTTVYYLTSGEYDSYSESIPFATRELAEQFRDRENAAIRAEAEADGRTVYGFELFHDEVWEEPLCDRLPEVVYLYSANVQPDEVDQDYAVHKSRHMDFYINDPDWAPSVQVGGMGSYIAFNFRSEDELRTAVLERATGNE